MNIQTRYQRITFVNEKFKERVTVDFDIRFFDQSNQHQKKLIEHVMIIELKQRKLNRNSPLFQLLKQKKTRPFRLSKYCIANALLKPTGKLKYNRFKKHIRHLNTISNKTITYE